MERAETSRNPQVADVVCERIERLIVDGVLKTGQLLPSDRKTRRFPHGTSRGPEAVARSRDYQDRAGQRLICC